MSTIIDVARLAGVSVGTVSNVLNDFPGVREDTRRRVLAAIETLDYHPLAAARSMKTQRTNTFGLIRIAERNLTQQFTSDPFVFELIEGLAFAAAAARIGLTYWVAPADETLLELYQTVVNERRTDGLIVFGLQIDDLRLEYLEQCTFPYVIFGRPAEPAPLNWIDVDGAYGLRLATEHLIGLGHRRIAYLEPPHTMLLAEQRRPGYVNAMRKAGLPVDPALVLEGDFSEESGKAGAQNLLGLSEPPTAIICSNDRMAFGAIGAAQAQGLVVGKDLSIVGFDDIALASHTVPSLTTVRQPVYEIGEQLFELLTLIVNHEPAQHLTGRLIKPRLQIRQSSGPAPFCAS